MRLGAGVHQRPVGGLPVLAGMATAGRSGPRPPIARQKRARRGWPPSGWPASTASNEDRRRSTTSPSPTATPSTSPPPTASTSASWCATCRARSSGRVELRQLTARDEARVQGGIGPCGRDLCCSTFLKDFEPVSVRMAKDQDLPLNPLKISGACGKLLCCLKYEHPLYTQFKATAPRSARPSTTDEGDGQGRRPRRAARRGRRPAGRRWPPHLVLAGVGLRLPPRVRRAATL